jgi:2-polyprenyl-3-methyl-5-hydroxy-6-metoxy-1,4-benzoquinol methylase
MEDLPSELTNFDLVALWHVIEHLHEPRAALRQTYNLLRPGGQIVIGTPNVAS